ncbi:MAG: hypothetical protein K8S23_15770 [Candidatus Cloacimonetes bacterium]|nr:hypothetical protein [Candidatus Cloacimonadota bacterium]
MKKLLLITYYWPPSGGAGVFRWLKLVKYLELIGWKCTIVTTKDGDYPAIDNSLLAEIGHDTEIIRTKTPVFGKFLKKIMNRKEKIPYGSLKSSKNDSLFRKISLFVRINLIIPDVRKIWIKQAYKAAKFEIMTDNFDFVITTGPPHSVHLVGLKLKNEFKINWVTDFRDPWSEIAYYNNVKRWKITKLADKFYEKKVVTKCDIMLEAAPDILAGFKKKKNVFTLMNAFDSADFVNVKKRKSDKFIISHFGQLTVDSEIKIFQLIASKMVEDGFEDIRFDFYGNNDKKVISDLQKEDNKNIFNFYGYFPHSEILQKIVDSSLLLLIIDTNRKDVITLKIFEYIGSKTPILGLAPLDSEPAKIINHSKSGKMIPWQNETDIVDFIKKTYKMWEIGEIGENRKKLISEYSWENRAEKLDEILENFESDWKS